MCWLEICLKNLNRGQGLGFTVQGVVVDKRTLKNIALAIGGGLTTLVTTLLALSEDAEMPSASSGVCGLSESENEAIRAMVNTFLVQRNATCVFNVTIDSIMRS